MKRNPLFEQCLAEVAPEVREEVRLNMDIANRIYDLLKARHLTQREFAAMLGKRESEISRWLTGTHGFTTASLAKIAVALGEPVVEVKNESRTKYVFVPAGYYMTFSSVSDGSFINSDCGFCRLSYQN